MTSNEFDDSVRGLAPPVPEGAPHPAEFGIGRLFWAIRDAVIVADAATEAIELWNPAAEEMFGYSVEEAVGMPLHRLVPEELVERHRAGLARYQEIGTGSLVDGAAPRQLPALRRGGSRIEIDLRLTALDVPASSGGRRVMAVVRDVTERVRAQEYEAALTAAEERQSQALELNDTIVQGLVVAKWALEVGDADRAFRVIGETLERAKEIVADLLGTIHPSGEVPPGSLRREGGTGAP